MIEGQNRIGRKIAVMNQVNDFGHDFWREIILGNQLRYRVAGVCHQNLAYGIPEFLSDLVADTDRLPSPQLGPQAFLELFKLPSFPLQFGLLLLTGHPGCLHSALFALELLVELAELLIALLRLPLTLLQGSLPTLDFLLLAGQLVLRLPKPYSFPFHSAKLSVMLLLLLGQLASLLLKLLLSLLQPFESIQELLLFTFQRLQLFLALLCLPLTPLQGSLPALEFLLLAGQLVLRQPKPRVFLFHPAKLRIMLLLLLGQLASPLLKLLLTLLQPPACLFESIRGLPQLTIQRQQLIRLSLVVRYQGRDILMPQQHEAPERLQPPVEIQPGTGRRRGVRGAV